MAQDLQSRADNDRGMARGLFSRGVQLMATRVVLYYRSQGHQVGGATCLLLGSPATTGVIGQYGAGLGAGKGRAPVAGPHPRSPRKRHQSGRGDTGYVNSPSSALQTSPPPPVGVQPGETTSSPTFSWHDARGDVQIVLRTTSSVSGFYGGRSSELQSFGYSSM